MREKVRKFLNCVYRFVTHEGMKEIYRMMREKDMALLGRSKLILSLVLVDMCYARFILAGFYFFWSCIL